MFLPENKKMRGRFLPLFLAFSLMSQMAQPFAFAGQGSAIPPAGKLPSDIAALRIPSFGKIEEFYQGKNPGRVFLIQDAHGIPDAQKNIEKIIAYFQRRYGVEHVKAEGAVSKLDAFIFRSFPDQKLLRQTPKK